MAAERRRRPARSVVEDYGFFGIERLHWFFARANKSERTLIGYPGSPATINCSASSSAC